MKKAFYLTFLTAYVISSCSKVSTEENVEIIEVVELNTNKPVAGASVTLYRCTDYDFVFGCRKIDVSSVYLTDKNGIAKVSSTDYNRANEGLKISKAGYWTQDGSMGRNELCPEGWIQLNIKRISNYPDSLFFFLFNEEERHLLPNSSVIKMKPKADTTILFRAFGSQKNTLSWLVGSVMLIGWDQVTYYNEVASGSLPAAVVPANGTIDLSLNY